jgi:hypothetical protein
VAEGVAVTDEPVEELRDVDGLHVYELAPEALSTVLCPVQTVSSGERETTGIRFTVTMVCKVAVQPAAEVPVTEYVVVETGVAVTLEPVEAFKVEEGLQTYEAAPVALSIAELPEQIACEGVSVIKG